MARPSNFKMGHNEMVTTILCIQCIGCDGSVELCPGGPGKPRAICNVFVVLSSMLLL
ncbi:hypothetical protein JB92DRAFT_3072133, partial [Gautieria morchelliformis]